MSSKTERVDDGVTRLMVVGHASTAGKTTVCLGLLSAALRVLPPSRIAYLKPVTQCEDPGPAAALASSAGVLCGSIEDANANNDSSKGDDISNNKPGDYLGPVVFFSGLTRAVLDGKVNRDFLGEAAARIDSAAAQVAAGGQEKHPVFGSGLVLVDGVGYPSVGSICGVGGADLAARARCALLIVGKGGVGDAIDSYEMLSGYSSSRGAHVIGAVFNRVSPSGFYGRESCEEYVTKWFARVGRLETNGDRPFGFLEERDDIEIESAVKGKNNEGEKKSGKGGNGETRAEGNGRDAVDAWFASRVRVDDLFRAAAEACRRYQNGGIGGGGGGGGVGTKHDQPREEKAPAQQQPTREEIEFAAIESGAPGCTLRRKRKKAD